MDDEGEKLAAVQSGNFPWLLASLAAALCVLAYLAGWYVGRHKVASRTAGEDPRAAPIGERRQQPQEHVEPRLEERPKGQVEECKYLKTEVHRLYEVYTVAELRELLAARGMVLRGGYLKKELLVDSAMWTSPVEMQMITQLTNELKTYGIDVKWRGRMLATGRDIQDMIATTAEVVNRLRERRR